MTASKLLLNLRTELQLSQIQMAMMLKTTQGNLSKLENGQEPSLEVFLRAARMASQCPSERIFERFCKFIWGKA